VADASFLGDGRVALAELDDASARLRFVDSEGIELGVVELGEAAGLEIAGERAPGRLVLTIRRGSGGEDRTTLCEVDTNSSPAGVTVLDEVAGRLWRGYTWLSARHQGTAGAFVDDRGNLRRFDFQSGSWRVLVGPGSTDR